MRALIRFVFSSLLVLTAGIAQAQTAAADPYEGRVTVADQGAGARDPALREALAQVLTRVSSSAAITQGAAILARAGTLVTRYGYERSGDTLQLVAAFDHSAVDAQLRAAGLPVWGYSAASQETVAITVHGLRSGSDYARAISSLRAIPGLRALNVLGADADQLQLSAVVEGGASRIVTALNGNREFAADAGNGATLQLRSLRSTSP